MERDALTSARRPLGWSFGWAIVLPVVLAACAMRQARFVPPALEVVSPRPPPPSSPAVWRPLPVPPRRGTAWPELGFHDGVLVLDDVGGRWFFPDDGRPPKSAEGLTTGLVAHQAHDVHGGLLSVSPSREVRVTDGPVAPWRTLLTLPEGALLDTVTSYRGALAFVTEDARGATQIHRWTASHGDTIVPGPTGYRPKQIMVGPDGVGAGLFLPERVFLTRDAGLTWQALATPELRVSSLGADGDRVLLLPGGVRDDFGRALDPRTASVERVHVRVAPHETAQARRRPPPRPWPGTRSSRDAEDELRAAHRELQSEDAAKRTLHRWLDGDRARSEIANDGDEIFVAVRGGWKPRLLLRGRIGEGVRPFGPSGGDACDVVSAALCDDLAAIGCKDSVQVFRGEARIATLSIEGPTQVAFDAASHLLTLVRDPDSGVTRLRVLDFSGGDDGESRVVFEAGGALPRFVGGCHRPGLWVSNEVRAARWSLDRLGDVVDLPMASAPLAVASDGSLLLSDETRLLRFPDGPETRIGPHRPSHLSFADDGVHGLFVSESGQVQQTDDGGLTFTPIESPTTSGRQDVRCGGARCQLGRGAVREGFGRDETPVAAWPPPVETTHRVGRKRSADASPGAGETAVLMRCHEDGEKLTGGKASTGRAHPVETRRPRLGAWAFGARGGAFGRETAVSDDGYADYDVDAGELTLRGDHPPERRLFHGWGEPAGDGVLHVERGGAWLVAEELTSTTVRVSRLAPDAPPRRRTFAVGATSAGEHGVGLLLGSPPSLALVERSERGGDELRLRALGDDLSLGEAVAVPGARAEAGASLELPACAPGARGGLTRLRDATPRRFEVDNSLVEGFLNRLVRVSPTGACVERTILARLPNALEPLVVVVGNEGPGGRGGGDIGGLRCERVRPVGLAPAPSPPPLSPGSAAPRPSLRPAASPSSRTPAGD